MIELSFNWTCNQENLSAAKWNKTASNSRIYWGSKAEQQFQQQQANFMNKLKALLILTKCSHQVRWLYSCFLMLVQVCVILKQWIDLENMLNLFSSIQYKFKVKVPIFWMRESQGHSSIPFIVRAPDLVFVSSLLRHCRAFVSSLLCLCWVPNLRETYKSHPTSLSSTPGPLVFGCIKICFKTSSIFLSNGIQISFQFHRANISWKSHRTSPLLVHCTSPPILVLCQKDAWLC